MNTTQWFGIAAGVMTAVSMLPQLIKIIKEKKSRRCFCDYADGINRWSWLVGGLWFYAGRLAHHSDQFIFFFIKPFGTHSTYKI